MVAITTRFVACGSKVFYTFTVAGFSPRWRKTGNSEDDSYALCRRPKALMIV
jgi:hypothetical protein